MNDLIERKIKLYTIPNCPKCNLIKKKLLAKKVSFETITDDEELSKLENDYFPQMQIDNGKIMNFSEINDWVNSLEVQDAN